jgi:hypothetical protein
MRAFAALAAWLLAAPTEEPYAAATRGAKCDLESSATLTCRYRVGTSLEFVLREVGEPGVALEVLRDNREGEYTLDPLQHGPCLFVRHGWSAQVAPGAEYHYATVSTVNGMVYRTLADCRRAR